MILRNPFPLWLWLVPFAGFVCAAPLWLHVWEPAMFVWLNNAFMPLPAQVWTGLSLLGNGWGVLGVTAPLLIASPRLMWAWVCAAPFAAAFARIGKEWIVSPRPAAVVDNQHIRVVGEVMHTVSMPSGHTTTAFAVACAMYLALNGAQKKRHVWVLLLALGTGLSRIAVGAHWPGDVAVGMCLGLLAGLLGNVLLQALSPRQFQTSSWGLRLIALAVAAAIYMLLTEPMDFAENLPIQRVVAAVAAASLLAFAIRSARSLKA
jgi:membrane-associated phospholipid phosphatase